MNGVLPANTAVMRDLQTTYGAAQLVLTVYLIATMFASIVLGNLADRHGRRPVMIGSLLVFAAGGFICMLAPTIEVLLIGRFVQGFGASVCVFLPRTIVRDVHPRDRAASVIGYMTTAMMVAPLFGPAVGGWVTDVSTWRWLYAGLGVLGVVFAVLAYRYQVETLQSAESRPVGSRFYHSAMVLLRDRLFQGYVAIQCGSVGVYYSFLGGAPYVLMELRGLSASEYGRWFTLVAIGYLTGNFIAGKLSERLGVDRMITLALIPGAIGIVLFWVLSGVSHPLGLFIPMQIIALSNGMCLPNVMSASMSVNPSLAGSASGIAGTLQTFVGIVFTVLLSVFLVSSALPLFVIITLSALVALWGLWLTRPRVHTLTSEL